MVIEEREREWWGTPSLTLMVIEEWEGKWWWKKENGED